MSRHDPLSKWLTFFFFYTVPGYVVMFILSLALWWMIVPIMGAALVADWRERRRGAR